MSKSDSTTYAISKSLHRSMEPAGRVRRIAAAVLVDDAVEITQQAGKPVTTRRKRTVEEMKTLHKVGVALKEEKVIDHRPKAPAGPAGPPTRGASPQPQETPS